MQNISATQNQALPEIQSTLQQIAESQTQADFQPIIVAQEQTTLALQQFSAAASQFFSEIIAAIQNATASLSQQLSAMTQSIASAIQNSSSQNQQQPVTVNSSPNINLGGAYVFDDSMKRQLTDDIAAEVADAVTSAVQTASRGANYGYGN